MTDYDRQILSRRQFVASSLVGAAAISGLSPLSYAAVPDVDLMDPMAPLSRERYLALRKTLQSPADAEQLVKNMWDKYVKTGQFKYGHWSMLYSQLWWQSCTPGPERLRVSKIARTMADKIGGDNPKHPAGPFWAAVHLGFEALVRGVLDSLNMIPKFFALLDEAEKRDSSYLMGSVYLAKAKAYLKLPPFPMSIGSLNKGFDYLEKARPLQEKHYALWYVVLAEGEMQKSGKEAALAALKGIELVCPVDMQSQYTLEISDWFAEKFREATADGSYNKYTWDPMLEPIIEMRDRPAVFGKNCG